ncbi:MAG: cysteine desulfurase-like protein [Gammaproteobacteria bacterium]|nr:cysteine desulfurase-like protein [Gammaproteobacteria bacterium]
MPFDLDAVRAQFPALALTDSGKRRIYFDGPAGTQVPQSVADAMSRCLLEANANVGGKFATSNRADAIVNSARAAMADLLNAPSPDEIVFGQNMTTLTFHLSRSLGRLFEPGDEIIVTRMDHDANVWPWVMLARDLGLEIRYLPFDTETYEFDLDEFDALLSERTRLVCLGAASNLTGTINDVRSICATARSAGALTYIDAVQSVPHIPTDVQALGCDFLVCSSYKFFGPHQGILWGRRDLLERLEPHKLRPAPERVPGRFETGTQSHESFAGITAAVDYLAWVGETMAGATGRPGALHAAMSLVFAYEKTLTAHLLDGLAALDGFTVHGITARDALDRRGPTVAFTHDRVAPGQIAQALIDENIFVWSGHNYAIELAGALGLLDSGGVLRVGPVHYNSVEEIDELLDVLRALPGS